MTKKIISLMLIFAMLIPFSPAVAADDTSAAPTVEEILNSYHEKAFAAQFEEDTASAATYSRRSGTEKTLEQETVDELTAAGYEAYNVTSTNYDALEESLKTDFSSLGLDPDGSYIIVVSGEEAEGSGNPNSRVVELPNYDTDIGVGSSSFSYTYDNGETFTMRYITVTTADNPNYADSDSYDLHSSKGLTLLNNCLNTAIYIAADYYTKTKIGTVMSILGIELVSFNTNYHSELTYYGGANWTRRWLQVYDADSDCWVTRVSVEYVTQNSQIYAYYYSTSLNRYVGEISKDATNIIYSSYYDDTDWQKEQAALAEINNNWYYYYTGSVKFYYGSTLMFTISEYYAP